MKHNLEACPQCNSSLQTRSKKPKLASYILFLISFFTFLYWTSDQSVFPALTKAQNMAWAFVQIALGVWVIIDRRKNRMPVFYCRSCNIRLSL